MAIEMVGHGQSLGADTDLGHPVAADDVDQSQLLEHPPWDRTDIFGVQLDEVSREDCEKPSRLTSRRWTRMDCLPATSVAPYRLA
jgi:hypothetical protein